MVLPRCPNCKKIYKFFRSDDQEFTYKMLHESPTCPFGLIAYHDLPQKCVDAVREHFKKEFPWKYKDARKALS